MKLNGIDVDWAEDFDGAITVCDTEGVIVYMNKYSVKQFAKYGGAELLGTNLLDCHPEPSKSKLRDMLQSPNPNMYTTEKENRKKIIVQKPWMLDGKFRGIVELSFELDPEMQHFIRD